MKRFLPKTLILLAVLLAGCGSSDEEAFSPGGPVPAEEELPPALVGGPPSDVPVTLQLQRWHMLDSDVSASSFRRMDELFSVSVVTRAGPLWELPRNEQ